MPRFYFHLHGGMDIVDSEGAELPDPDAARRYAHEAACDLMREDLRLGRMVLHQWIEVVGEHGERVLSLPFSAAVDIGH